MSANLEITVLGCGSSGGVPRADGAFGACDPKDRRNWRTRCSLMVRRPAPEADAEAWTTVIVDASPEFRLQAAAARARRLDALLLTHEHADQCHGLDDIRAFALRQAGPIDCWMDGATSAVVRTRFAYAFEGVRLYPAIAGARATPPHGEGWEIAGPSGPIPVATFAQSHGDIMSLGYRFGGVAYSSDLADLPAESFAALEGLDLWIVDALRYAPHPTHAHVERTLGWIERLKPRRAILTNLHIDLDYTELAARLPPGVEPAYDGLRVTVPLAEARP